MNCAEFPAQVNEAERQVGALKDVARLHPNPAVQKDCRAFSAQVAVVEELILATYAGAVLCAKSAEPEAASKIWQRMGGVCTAAVETVRGLKDKYPHCGTPQLYDTLLDYALACRDRLNDADSDILCQKNPPPKGLFPENS